MLLSEFLVVSGSPWSSLAQQRKGGKCRQETADAGLKLPQASGLTLHHLLLCHRPLHAHLGLK